MPTDCDYRLGTGTFNIVVPSGQRFEVHRHYRCGTFALHRSIWTPGWTLTHARTGVALIQHIPTLTLAHEGAHRLQILTPKWDRLSARSLDGFWGQYEQLLNVREQWAIVVNLLVMGRRWRAIV